MQPRLISILLIYLSLTACHLTTDINHRQTGRQIAFSRSKGNCLACHRIEKGEFAGNIAPELKNLSSRFKNKAALRLFIWDASRFNPQTSMPPFGRNKILTEQELEQVVDYLWTLNP